MNAIVSQPPVGGAVRDAAPRRPLVVEALLAAVMVGVFYSLSPTTIWVACLVALVIVWAARDFRQPSAAGWSACCWGPSL
jgi:hypothetical protein